MIKINNNLSVDIGNFEVEINGKLYRSEELYTIKNICEQLSTAEYMAENYPQIESEKEAYILAGKVRELMNDLSETSAINSVMNEYTQMHKEEIAVDGGESLFDYLQQCEEGDEITVWDTAVDVETYFYTDFVNPTDDWDRAMGELAKKLTVVQKSDRGVTVNLYDIIEKNIDNINRSELFNTEMDTEDIMDVIESILSGNVSEKWMQEFVDAIVLYPNARAEEKQQTESTVNGDTIRYEVSQKSGNSIDRKTIPVITYDYKKAEQLGTVDEWRQSRNENTECYKATVDAIEANTVYKEYGQSIDTKNAILAVLKEYPIDRVALLLAHEVYPEQNYIDDPWCVDRRFSEDVKEWAKNTITSIGDFHFESFVGCSIRNNSHTTIVNKVIKDFIDIQKSYQEEIEVEAEAEM